MAKAYMEEKSTYFKKRKKKKKDGTVQVITTVASLKVCSNPSPRGFSVLSLHILHASVWLLLGPPVFPPLETCGPGVFPGTDKKTWTLCIT